MEQSQGNVLASKLLKFSKCLSLLPMLIVGVCGYSDLIIPDEPMILVVHHVRYREHAKLVAGIENLIAMMCLRGPKESVGGIALVAYPLPIPTRINSQARSRPKRGSPTVLWPF